METNAPTTKNKDKKRGSVFSEIARKRARVSLSSVKQDVSRSASCDSVAAVVASIETSVKSKKRGLKVPNIPTSDPLTRSHKERCDLKEWTCEKCTLVNPVNRKRCQACGSREPIKTSVPSLESFDSSLPRRVYSTPGENNSLRADTSIVVKLVEKLDTPKSRKREKAPIRIENSLSHQRVTRSAHLRIELDEDDDGRKFERNDKEGRNILQSERLLSPNYKENTPSDRKALETSILLDEGVTATEKERPYQQLQSMLTGVLDKLDSMTKQMHVQRDEIQSLQEQNKDILLTHTQIINENRELRASLLILKTSNNVGQTETEPGGASVGNVRPEAKHATSTNALMIGVCLSLIAVLMYCKLERSDSLGRYGVSFET